MSETPARTQVLGPAKGLPLPDAERLILAFEMAWQRGERPDPLAFPRETPCTERAIVLELVHLDMEFRARTGEAPRLEDYLPRITPLSQVPDLLELLGTEIRLRRRGGETLHEKELVARFPQWEEGIDRLLHEQHPTSKLGRPTTRAPSPNLSAPILADFDLQGEVGRGGMGVVYRAWQKSLQRWVAIKTLAQLPDEKALQRFAREAEAMARLDHPHIVPIYEVGQWHTQGRSLPYFVMKWYAGGNLHEQPAGPGTALAASVERLEKVARAVHHAHERGVLHRDLKPSNILLDEQGEPAVADFGLAGWFQAEAPQPRTNSLVGTPAFMAPEQAQRPSAVTTSADIYGLGAILYHVLTGHPPFEGETLFAVLERVQERPPVAPRSRNPEVPLDLQVICLKCLAKLPQDRYTSAGAVADDLHRWRTGQPILARPLSMERWLRRLMLRHPLTTALALSSVLGFGALVVTLWVSNALLRHQETQTREHLQREQIASYLDRVTAAGRLIASNQLDIAWPMLDACPDNQRGWEWHYLRGLHQAGLIAETAVDQPILQATIRSDGRVFLVDRDQQVLVWDQQMTPQRWTHRASRVVAHPHRGWLAVQHAGQLTLLDEQERPFTSLPCTGWFDFDPSGNWLIGSTSSGAWRLDLRTRDFARHPLAGSDTELVQGCFADGHLLASDARGRTQVWEIENPATPGKRLADTSGLRQTFWSADRQIRLEVSRNRLRTLRGLTTQRVRDDEVLLPATTLLPLPSLGAFALSRPSGEVLVRSIATGEEIRLYRGQRNTISTLAADARGESLLSVALDGHVKLWQLRQPQDHQTIPLPGERYSSLTLCPDGKCIGVAARSMSGPAETLRVAIVDLASGQVVAQHPGCAEVAFSPQGQWYAVGHPGSGVALYDQHHERRAILPTDAVVTRLRASGDGRYLAAALLNGSVCVWDRHQGDALQQLHRSSQPLYALDWRPGTSELAIGHDGTLEYWNIPEARLVRQLPIPTSPVVMAHDLHGTRVAVAGRQRTLVSMPVDSPGPLREMIGSPGSVEGLAFHPTENRLASASNDGWVRIWDNRSGRELITLPCVHAPGGAVVWSRDGRTLVGLGPQLRLWHAPR